MSNVSIEKLDKNLAIAGLSGDESLAFYDPEEAPFKMYGVYREGDCLVRMPGEIAKTVNRKVAVFMRRNSVNIQSPAVFFAAGFFVGLFIKFLPLFLLLMLLLLVSDGFLKCFNR